MRVFLIGSGGREHALAAQIVKSQKLDFLYVAPGNPGIAQLEKTECVGIGAQDIEELIVFSVEKQIDLVVVGPEVPLSLGIADKLASKNIACFGPSQLASQLESSKKFTKEICKSANIPTADSRSFSDIESARSYLHSLKAPFVIKADGLAAGKGVVIAQTFEQAVNAVDSMLNGQFGDSSTEILIEEFLSGEEASVFAFVDGETVVPLATAQDHKRAFDGDEGPNTGGMGAYSPAPIVTDAILNEIMTKIIQPTAKEMVAQNMPYRGILYAGLMLTESGPKLIEYNCRFGDPECQVIMPRTRFDILELFHAVANGKLDQFPDLQLSEDFALCVVIAAKGYPGNYIKGDPIRGLEHISKMDAADVYHAGTKAESTNLNSFSEIRSHGGRVLNIIGVGENISKAYDKAYEAVNCVDWPGGFYRTDIGAKAMRKFR